MNEWFPEPARAEIARQANLATFEVFELLESTSDYALEHAEEFASRLPALFVARRQTKGRGRNARAWFAGEGALTFSLLLGTEDVPLPPSDWHRVSLIAGVAMCLALERYTIADDLRVKWPNDVYLNGRKACGILIEKRELGSPLLCVGVGVNVNNSLEQAPEEVRQRAIALIDVTGQWHFLPEILLEFLQHFRRLCDENAASLERLLPLWATRCLLTGRQVETQQGTSTVAGECRGIDAGGALVIQTASGRREIVSGEILRW